MSDLEYLIKTRERLQALERAQRYNWDHWARPAQREPEDYDVWVIKAGRRFGKGRAASETLRKWGEKPGQHFAVIGQRNSDIRDICFGGPSGLIACIPPELIRKHNKSLGDTYIELTNGTIYRAFSSAEPDNLRGHHFDGGWVDEWAAFHPSVAQECLDQLDYCMGGASGAGKVIITTTPRPTKHVKARLKAAEDDPRIVVTSGRTLDNIKNLNPALVEKLIKKYGGTRQGRQELEGELLTEIEGTLWTPDQIASARAPWDVDNPPKRFDRIVVGYDPSGSVGGDAAGVVVVAISGETLFVLADYTTNGTAETRFEAACIAAHQHGASAVYYENAYGGDMNAAGLRSAWKHLRSRETVEGEPPKFLPSTLRGDKARRAEPICGIYEQGRVVHAPELELLEAEMTEWAPGEGGASPNRIDSMVHAARHLTDKPRNAQKPQVPKGPLAAAKGTSPFGGKRMR